MSNQYRCTHPQRLQAVRAHPSLNGIDYLEVLDLQAPEEALRQRTLLLRCVKPMPAGLNASNVRLSGGVRVTDIAVTWAHRADQIPAALLTPAEQTFFASQPEPDHLFAVRTGARGDFSTYRLCLTASATLDTPPGTFDPLLACIDFSFKVECPSDFDCVPRDACPPETWPQPQIDYLAKDYQSFRRLLLDRLALVVPDWQERNPADLGIALVEVLAYVADRLSYFQDAVATEAYLGTARKRVSVRRHARLLDYRVHEGTNARAWVHLDVAPGGAADGLLLPEGTPLYTKVSAERGTVTAAALAPGLREGAQVFETMHDVILRAGLNEVPFYTWGDDDCCLPKGATQATLRGALASVPLAAGDALLFEEVLGVRTGMEADADRAHRHVVRLRRPPEERTDPLTGDAVLDVAWFEEDALPFALCLWNVKDPAGRLRPVAVARGNLVLADAGVTITEAPEPATVPLQGRYRPALGTSGVTHRLPYDDLLARAAASAQALVQDPRAALAAVSLTTEGDPDDWTPQPDLLDSDRFAQDFVVEMDEGGLAQLRFGDNVLGRRPPGGATFTATYRVGNGPTGNVGAGAIAHVTVPGVRDVRNPLPAVGGTAPEALEQVRLYAPQAFRVQKRAVTEADYAAVAEQHPEVQKAVARRRWTGSWSTIFVAIDRKAGRPVDAAFEDELRAHLDRYRLAGHDVEIDPPRFVSLDIALRVCVQAGFFRDAVQQALLETFSSLDLPDGRRGLFHPDNLTFGQTVYLSPLIAAAMDVAGVRYVEALRFQRWGRAADGELEAGRIDLARLEIARLDNDPNRPENGKIIFEMEGGL